MAKRKKSESGGGERDPASFPIVGIGASAGGIEATKELLAALPAEPGMSFLVVHHLDPTQESHLAQVLSGSTPLPVVEAHAGVEVEPNRVYVIPRASDISVEKGLLRLTPRGSRSAPHLPVDQLFRSLAREHQARSIGVVLSGTGADGTLGLEEIKAAGGITFSQDEESAGHSGMPRSAIGGGCVDFVLPPAEIGRRLAAIGRHPYLAKPAAAAAESGAGDSYRRILTLVRGATGVDFSQYRDTTIQRRIMRRMALHSADSLAQYAASLEGNGKEIDALYHDLLINVTSFFRDPEVFAALKERVFPEIADKDPTEPVRVWVPGCSTGQEVYSIAMALFEFYDDKHARPPIQVFATDLSDQRVLERARSGLYPESIENELSPGRLRRFFKREDHHFRIDKNIRDACVFARQNVVGDPPFSHLDLISCRNVLIYMGPALQQRVLRTFQYALNVPGFLLLGTAESVGEHADLFELIDRTNKIYRKRPIAAHSPLHFSAGEMHGLVQARRRTSGHTVRGHGDWQREADRILLSRFAPPGVLVNERFDVLQYHGRTGRYLDTPIGEPTNNLLKLAREGLFLELRSALAEAQKTHQSVRRGNLRVRTNGGHATVEVEVVPVRMSGSREGCLLVLFHERPEDGAPLPAPREPEAPQPLASGDGDPSDEHEVLHLRQELAATKEYLQSLIEQQDAANEELRSANEEILSSNEELQSTNEELETAKEELQSANEELTTVNEQLQHRNQELTLANNDVTNLLASADIPLVMVSGDLRIRRFTRPAKHVMKLLPTDVGRPLADIRPPVHVPDLEQIIQEVIDTVQPREREVCDDAGRWYLLRVHPYRTSDNRIDGAVLLLLDIDVRKRAEDTLRETDRRKDEFLATLSHELRNPLAPILTAVEIMRHAGDDVSAVEEARTVLDRQVRQLSRIVDDLIDVSRIVERKIVLNRERIDLATIVETALETCRSRIEGMRHELTVRMPRAPVFLDVDPVRMSQVLINLLGNASKFTQLGGKIWVEAEVARAGQTQASDVASLAGELILRVRDDGIGIPSESLDRVFEMFVQAEEGRHSGRGGLGIGLTLARSLVHMHGGTIEARSEGQGHGTEFVVRLPVAAEQAPARHADQPSDGPTPMCRILVVDDNSDHERSLGVLLRLMGHVVRTARDGPEAIAVAVDFRPDVALVDIGLPGMNGYEVARRLRSDPRHHGIVLVAQTGWSQTDDRQRSEDAGFDAHLVKPVAMEDLERILRSVQPRG